MKTVAWIPMKLNNERLPNKNTLMLGDKPLCRHLLDTLTSVKGIDEIYVFCSREEIIDYLPEGVKFLKRSEELDKPTTQHFEIVDAFMSQVDADVYVNAHVTTPFLKASTIQDGLDKVLSGEYESAHAVLPMRSHFWYKNEPLNFTRFDIPKTQDLEPLYEDCVFFIYKREVRTEQHTRYSKNPYFMLCSIFEAIDIDYPEDFQLAQAVYNTYLRK